MCFSQLWRLQVQDECACIALVLGRALFWAADCLGREQSSATHGYKMFPTFRYDRYQQPQEYR